MNEIIISTIILSITLAIILDKISISKSFSKRDKSVTIILIVLIALGIQALVILYWLRSENTPEIPAKISCYYHILQDRHFL